MYFKFHHQQCSREVWCFLFEKWDYFSPLSSTVYTQNSLGQVLTSHWHHQRCFLKPGILLMHFSKSVRHLGNLTMVKKKTWVLHHLAEKMIFCWCICVHPMECVEKSEVGSLTISNLFLFVSDSVLNAQGICLLWSLQISR